MSDKEIFRGKTFNFLEQTIIWRCMIMAFDWIPYCMKCLSRGKNQIRPTFHRFVFSEFDENSRSVKIALEAAGAFISDIFRFIQDFYRWTQIRLLYHKLHAVLWTSKFPMTIARSGLAKMSDFSLLGKMDLLSKRTNFLVLIIFF